MSKVKIYTWADKAPEFLYEQYETIKKFVKDEDWEFIVFNNVPFPKLDRQIKIKKICKELGVKCYDVRFRSFVSGAAQICAWGIHWAYHRFFRWEKDTIHVIFDSDMFFIRDFNFNEYLGDNDICAIHQRRGNIEYLWNGIVVMRGGHLPDKSHFDYRLGDIHGERTDVGGRLHYWLERNPNLKVKYIKHTGHLDVSGSIMLPEKCRAGYKPEYCFQFIEHAILHYRAGSNWDKKSKDFVDTKKAYFKELLNEVLNNNGKVSDAPDLYITLQERSLDDITSRKIVKLSGGLGNQMFQYALAYVLSKAFYTRVVLDFSWFEAVKSIKNLTARSFELDVFNIEYRKATEEDLAKVDYTKHKSLIKKILWKVFRVSRCRPPRNVLLPVDTSAFYKDIFTARQYYYYDGYFQNEKYFKHVRADLLKAFSLNIPLDEKNKATLEKIQSENSISIHVRRGDYVTLESARNYHGICPLEYYQKAINYMAKNVENPHFYLFSDDIDWVIKNLKLDYPFTVVDFNQGKGSLDMNLIKNCKHNIIANSSFSWWGAWLNENPNKIVIAPKKWKATKFKKCDTVPSDWIKF